MSITLGVAPARRVSRWIWCFVAFLLMCGSAPSGFCGKVNKAAVWVSATDPAISPDGRKVSYFTEELDSNRQHVLQWTFWLQDRVSGTRLALAQGKGSRFEDPPHISNRGWDASGRRLCLLEILNDYGYGWRAHIFSQSGRVHRIISCSSGEGESGQTMFFSSLGSSVLGYDSWHQPPMGHEAFWLFGKGRSPQKNFMSKRLMGIYPLAVAPDASSVLFSANSIASITNHYPNSGQPELYLLNLASGHARRISFPPSGTWNFFHLHGGLIPWPPGGVMAAAFEPDGQHFILVGDDWRHIWRVRVSDGARRNITPRNFQGVKDAQQAPLLAVDAGPVVWFQVNDAVWSYGPGSPLRRVMDRGVVDDYGYGNSALNRVTWGRRSGVVYTAADHTLPAISDPAGNALDEIAVYHVYWVQFPSGRPTRIDPPSQQPH